MVYCITYQRDDHDLTVNTRESPKPLKLDSVKVCVCVYTHKREHKQRLSRVAEMCKATDLYRR